MPDVKISALPAAATVGATDPIPVVAGGVTSKATPAQIVAAAGGVGVTKIIAGTNVTISPTGGTGDVTINASGGGSSLAGVTQSATPFLTSLGAGASTTATGTNNTFLGYNAGNGVTTGANNTFVGSQSGDAHTAGNNNTAVGYNTAGSAGGSNNTVVGYTAGNAVNAGNSNTFIGSSAGDQATSADSCTAVGQGALGAIAVATGATAIGANSLAVLTSGTSNTALGYYAANSVTTGDNNTSVGFNALRTAATVSNNTAVGTRSLYAATSAGNTAVGNNSGQAVSSGANNTLIGNGAGSVITTGANNTIVGVYPATGAPTLTGAVVLADGLGNARFYASSTGSVQFSGGGAGQDGQVLKTQGVAGAPNWGNQNQVTYASKTATTPLIATESVIFANATAGDMTLTLPNAALNGGLQIYVKRIDSVTANTLTIASAGGTIEGGATSTMGPLIAVQYMSDGTNWWELSND